MPNRDKLAKTTRPIRSSDRPSTKREKVSLAASSRAIRRVPWFVGKSTAFMLELLSSATTIATPCPAIRVTPPTVCGRASAKARPPMASPRNKAGSARSQTQPIRPDGVESRRSWARRSSAAPVPAARGAASRPGARTSRAEQNA